MKKFLLTVIALVVFSAPVQAALDESYPRSVSATESSRIAPPPVVRPGLIRRPPAPAPSLPSPIPVKPTLSISPGFPASIVRSSQKRTFAEFIASPATTLLINSISLRFSAPLLSVGVYVGDELISNLTDVRVGEMVIFTINRTIDRQTKILVKGITRNVVAASISTSWEGWTGYVLSDLGPASGKEKEHYVSSVAILRGSASGSIIGGGVKVSATNESFKLVHLVASIATPAITVFDAYGGQLSQPVFVRGSLDVGEADFLSDIIINPDKPIELKIGARIISADLTLVGQESGSEVVLHLR